jgi:hypothetical protein
MGRNLFIEESLLREEAEAQRAQSSSDFCRAFSFMPSVR